MHRDTTTIDDTPPSAGLLSSSSSPVGRGGQRGLSSSASNDNDNNDMTMELPDELPLFAWRSIARSPLMKIMSNSNSHTETTTLVVPTTMTTPTKTAAIPQTTGDVDYFGRGTSPPIRLPCTTPPPPPPPRDDIKNSNIATPMFDAHVDTIMAELRADVHAAQVQAMAMMMMIPAARADNNDHHGGLNAVNSVASADSDTDNSMAAKTIGIGTGDEHHCSVPPVHPSSAAEQLQQHQHELDCLTELHELEMIETRAQHAHAIEQWQQRVVSLQHDLHTQQSRAAVHINLVAHATAQVETEWKRRLDQLQQQYQDVEDELLETLEELDETQETMRDLQQQHQQLVYKLQEQRLTHEENMAAAYRMDQHDDAVVAAAQVDMFRQCRIYHDRQQHEQQVEVERLRGQVMATTTTMMTTTRGIQMEPSPTASSTAGTQTDPLVKQHYWVAENQTDAPLLPQCDGTTMLPLVAPLRDAAALTTRPVGTDAITTIDTSLLHSVSQPERQHQAAPISVTAPSGSVVVPVSSVTDQTPVMPKKTSIPARPAAQYSTGQKKKNAPVSKLAAPRSTSGTRIPGPVSSSRRRCIGSVQKHHRPPDGASRIIGKPNYLHPTAASRRTTQPPPPPRVVVASSLTTTKYGRATQADGAVPTTQAKNGPQLLVITNDRDQPDKVPKRSPKELIHDVLSDFADDEPPTTALALTTPVRPISNASSSRRVVDDKFQSLSATWSAHKEEHSSTPTSRGANTGRHRLAHHAAINDLPFATPAVQVRRCVAAPKNEALNLNTPFIARELQSGMFSPEEELLVSPKPFLVPVPLPRASPAALHTTATMDQQQQNAAAMLIQAMVRRQAAAKMWHQLQTAAKLQRAGLTLHSVAQQTGHNHFRAATIIQRAYRVSYSPLRRWRTAAALVQTRFRACRRQQQLRLEQVTHQKRVVVLQALVRCYLARQHFAQAMQSNQCKAGAAAASKIQALIRANKCRAMYRRRRDATILLQTFVRGLQDKVLVQHVRLVAAAAKTERAVICLQRSTRRFLQRTRLARAHALATTCQRMLRGRRQRDRCTAQQMAATNIQAVFRAWRQQRRLDAVVAIQTAVRRYRAQVRLQCARDIARHGQRLARGRRQRAELVTRQTAVIKLQCALRTWRVQRLAQIQSQSVTLVQSTWRCRSGTQQWKASKFAAIKIQTLVRRMAARRFVAHTMLYLKRARAALYVQQCWRMHVTMSYRKRAVAAAIRMQTLARMAAARVVMARAIQQHTAAIMLQKHWRRGIEINSYFASRSAMLLLQSAGRRMLARNHVARARRSIRILMAAALMIQGMYRCHAARRGAEQMKQNQLAVICIQSFLRMHSHRSSLVRRCVAIRRIQAMIRGRIARKVAHKVKAQKARMAIATAKPSRPALGSISNAPRTGAATRRPFGSLKETPAIFSPPATRQRRVQIDVAEPENAASTLFASGGKALKPVDSLKVVELREELIKYGLQPKELRNIRKAGLIEMVREHRGCQRQLIDSAGPT